MIESSSVWGGGMRILVVSKEVDVVSFGSGVEKYPLSLKDLRFREPFAS